MTETNPLELALASAAATDLGVGQPELIDVAAAAGLLDVAYASLDSPVGKLLVAVTPRGLVRVAYLDNDSEDAVLEQLAAKISPRVLAAPRKLDEPRRELEAAFAGPR